MALTESDKRRFDEDQAMGDAIKKLEAEVKRLEQTRRDACEREMRITRNWCDEITGYEDKIERLTALLKGCEIGGCWCPAGIGRPSFSSHSDHCKATQKELGQKAP